MTTNPVCKQLGCPTDNKVGQQIVTVSLARWQLQLSRARGQTKFRFLHKYWS